MSESRLSLYRLDHAYVAELARHDHRVMSTSPSQDKQNRPFVGVVIVHGDRKYCIPLSSPKPKHEAMKADRDFSKIVDKRGKLIGVLNFNNMIPVDDRVLLDLDLVIRPDDPSWLRSYKNLMQDQLDWINANRELVLRKAAKLYDIVTEHPETAVGLARRCCDFRLLEGVLEHWIPANKG